MAHTFTLTHGSIAAIATIRASDNGFSARQWSAIYVSADKPAAIYPDGEMSRDVAHSFPQVLRAIIAERFARVFAADVMARDAIIAELRSIRVEPLILTRIRNDGYGNPRYVAHFLSCIPDAPRDAPAEDIGTRYARACKLMNRIGGRKYHCRAYGGGIVFQSYSVDELAADVSRLTGRTFYPVID